jgi:DNA-binding LytR/AlgR family response regulator
MENTLISVGGRKKVWPEDVIVLVADANYSLLYMADGKVIHVATTLRILEERLTNHSFFRSHRSYLINTNHVLNFDQENHLFVQMKNNMVATVARKKREIFKSEIATLLLNNMQNLAALN